MDVVKAEMRDRFIPTYVGHTVGYPVRCGNVAVHPHIRGAYHLDFVGDGKHGGSSPHTWGIRQFAAFAPVKVRFIPTYVGHTVPEQRSARSLPVHPHIRGAYAPDMFVYREPVRFIPTYVGHTASYTAVNLLETVHPHIRGAYQ